MAMATPVLDRLPNDDPRSVANYHLRQLPTEIVEQRKIRSIGWQCKPRLDQGQEGACFTGDMLIRMADGSQKRIEDLRLLDQVVTAEGNTGPVTHLMVRAANRGLVRVDIAGHMPLRCTPEHPVLTSRGYVAAENLVVGDLVAVTRYSASDDAPLDTAALIDMHRFRGVLSGEVNTGGIVTTVAPVPALLARTPALGRLIGLYAAEGHTTENKVVWSYGEHEKGTLVAETRDLVKAVFDAEARIQVRPNGAINVVLYGKAWRSLFEQLVPGTSKRGDKQLSFHVTHGSPEFLRAILEGWLAGDGHMRRTEWTGVTVCRALALDMHALANTLGLRPHLNESAPSVNQHAATRQRRYQVGFGTGGGSNRSAQQNERATWRRVRAVTPEGFEGNVYNFEVEGDHSYVADGIGVHNCVGFGMAHELAASPKPVPQTNEDALHWYRGAQTIDEYPDHMPGTSVRAAAEVVRQAGLITEYRWGTSLADLQQALMYGPVILGLDWKEGMFHPDASGVIRATGRILGGHCVAAIGQSFKTELVRLRQSWGADHGINGDVYIPFPDLAALIAADGDVCIPITRRLAA